MTERVDTTESVRIGELRSLVTGTGDSLVAVGLGSCVGVAVIDEVTGAAALAHVFLPEQPESGSREGAGPGTYANTAIPELVRRVVELAGASSRTVRLVAIIAGGSKMFGSSGGADVGARNAEAVNAALAALRIPIATSDLGGARGRTMRVTGVAGGGVRVTVRVVGSEEQEMWSSSTTTASKSAPSATKSAPPATKPAASPASTDVSSRMSRAA
jgi:chemotaxis protein CheD